MLNGYANGLLVSAVSAYRICIFQDKHMHYIVTNKNCRLSSCSVTLAIDLIVIISNKIIAYYLCKCRFPLFLCSGRGTPLPEARPPLHERHPRPGETWRPAAPGHGLHRSKRSRHLTGEEYVLLPAGETTRLHFNPLFAVLH